MKLSRQSEFLLELYALEKHGVPRTHLECLFWFYLNDGKIVDYDTLQGRYVPGRTKNGEDYVSRRPIQAIQTVKGPPILPSTIRGWYKPGGGKILGYDEDAKKIDWDGTDEFVQSLQLAHDPENYDSEITKSDNHGNWLEMVYHHDEKKQYFEIDNGNIQNCFKHKIPVGICENITNYNQRNRSIDN